MKRWIHGATDSSFQVDNKFDADLIDRIKYHRDGVYYGRGRYSAENATAPKELAMISTKIGSTGSMEGMYEAILNNENTPSYVAERVKNIMKDESSYKNYEEAKINEWAQTSSDLELLKALIDLRYYGVSLSQNPNMTPELFSYMDKKGGFMSLSKAELEAVVDNPNIPEDCRDSLKFWIKYHENRMKQRDEQKHKTAREKVNSKWRSAVAQLQDDYEDGIDPFYEGTEAGDYITSICTSVEESLNLYVEPSVQGGRGGIWIYDEADDNKPVVENYDYESFNDHVADIAFASTSLATFKKKYKDYLLQLVNR